MQLADTAGEPDAVEVYVKRVSGLDPKEIRRVELRLLGPKLFPNVDVVNACLVRPNSWQRLPFPRNLNLADVAMHYVQVVFVTKVAEEQLQLLLPMRIVMAQEQPASLPVGTAVFKTITLWKWGSSQESQDE
ncbi:unnamed protein product, partial [Amoebophrya sp. A120]|eukprot:GSA120T00010944001.1